MKNVWFRSRSATLLTVAALGFLPNACSGGARGTTPPLSNFGAPDERPQLHGATSFRWGGKLLDKAVYLGPATFTHLSVNVEVRMRDESALRAYARSASDPHSSTYRKFLTPQQIGDRFGATPDDYLTVANYFAGKGLSVGGWPQRMSLAVAGSQQQLERAFGTTFAKYRRNGTVFIAPRSTPRFAANLPVTGITNIVHFRPERPLLIRGSGASFTGFGPRQLARGFDFNGPYGAGYSGSGISIGIVGTAGISPDDVPLFAKDNGSDSAAIRIVPAIPQPASAQNNNTP